MKDGKENGTGRFSAQKTLGCLAFSCAVAPIFALAGGVTGLAGADRCLWVPFLSFAVSALLLSLPPFGGAWTLTLGALLTMAAAAAVIRAGVWSLALAVPAAAVTMLMLSKRNAQPGDEWSDGIWTLGVAAAPAAFVLEKLLGLSGEAAPGNARTLIYVVFLLLFLMQMNRRNLESSSHAVLTGRRVPLKVRVQNRLAVAMLFLVGAAAVFSSGIGAALKRLWKGLAVLIVRLIAFLTSLFDISSPREGGGAGGENAFLGGADQADPNPVLIFLEKVLKVLAAALIAVLVFLALRFLWKKLRVLWKLVREKLAEMARGSSEDYVDEITATRDFRDEKSPFAIVRTRRKKEREPDGGREQVRWLYRRYLRTHPAKQGLTCREALKDEKEYAGFAALYETARYSEHPVSDASVAEARERVRGKGL